MMTGARAQIAILSAGIILSAVSLVTGCAEEADRESAPPAATRPAKPAEESGSPSAREAIASGEFQLQRRRDWWNHAREVLFTDIQLSAEQLREVDAIIDEQIDNRAQQQQRDAELQAARRSRDPERIATARAAFAAIRAQLKGPHEIYEELRALLSEEQRPAFDMNRARHVAENRTPAKQRTAPTE